MPADSGGAASVDVKAAVFEILGSFNKTGVQLGDGTRFTEDLNFDSLVVMEFVSVVEDRFDISVPLNLLPDIETVGQLVSAIEKIIEEEHG